MPTFDPISGAPLSSIGAGLSQSITHSLGMGDSFGLNVDYTFNPTHTLSISDQVLVNAVLNIGVSNTLTIGDSVNLALVLIRSLTDSYSISDEHSVQFIDNTEPYDTLNLSQDFVLSVIRSFYLEDTYLVTDIAQREFRESLAHSLILSDSAVKFVPEFSISQTLSFNQLVSARQTLNISLIDTLSLSQNLLRILSQNVTQTVIFTSQIDNRLLPSGNFSDLLNLTQGVDALTNLDTHNNGNLQLTQNVTFDLLVQQNLSQTITFSQLINVFNFAVQTISNSFNVSQDLNFTLFEQQDYIQNLIFSQGVVDGILRAQQGPNSLNLSHSVSVTVSISGEQDTRSSLNFRQSVTLNQVKHFDICECLHFTDSVHKSIPLDIVHNLVLSDGYIPGQPVDTLVLGHEVNINVTIDECCEVVFVQDKIVKNQLSFSHSVSLNQSNGHNVSSVLTLNQTVAYYKL